MDDRLPFAELLSNLQKTLQRAGRLAAAALIIGVLIPGYIQFQRKTFFAEDIETKIPYPQIRKAITDFKSTSADLNKALTSLNQRIVDGAKTMPAEEILKLTETHANLERQVEKRQEPYHVAPVYLDPLVIVWMLFYTSFFWIIFLLAPKVQVKIAGLDTFWFFAGIWLFFRCPTWLRNTELFRDKARKVYAGTNYDIDVPSFFLQEFQAMIVCLLITAVMLIWSNYFSHWRSILLTKVKETGRACLLDLTESLTRQFVHWQICSILLAIAFLPYTYFFWKYVTVLQDMRYMFHAIVVHAMWGIVWLTISAPVFFTGYKIRILSLSKAEGKDDEALGDDAPESEGVEMAIGQLNFVGSIITACVTFVAPILKTTVFG